VREATVFFNSIKSKPTSSVKRKAETNTASVGARGDGIADIVGGVSFVSAANVSAWYDRVSGIGAVESASAITGVCTEKRIRTAIIPTSTARLITTP
jgi:hypothetical protein